MGRLLAVFVLALALALPFTDVPVIDDWAYAYSVDQLLQSGRFRILDYSCRYNLVQVLWGALFSLPAGLSFAALRLSTVALALPGLWAFHDMLRRRTGNASVALWTTALLAFNPLFFRLTLSFMTDVPLLALVAIAFWLFDRGLDARSPLLIAAAIVVVVVGYLVRELAIVAPAALLGAALVARDRRMSFGLILLLAALAAVGFALEFWWIRSVQGTTWGLEARTQGLRHLLEVPLATYGSSLLQMLLVTAAFVAPLALATCRDRVDLLWSLAGGVVIAAAALASGAIPFGAQEVLSPLGLGMSRVLLPGEAALTSVGQGAREALFAVACISLSLLLREFVSFCGSWWSRRRALDTAWVLFGLGQVAALLALWLWQDRYDLVLLPTALWLLALRAARVGWSARAVGIGTAVFAVVSVLGTRDDFELNRSAWAAEAWLRGQGVAAGEIDGGYVLNGWRLYSYPERFAPGFAPERVPFLFSQDRLSYAIATTSAGASQVLREFTWRRTWLGENHLYAVRQATD